MKRSVESVVDSLTIFQQTCVELINSNKLPFTDFIKAIKNISATKNSQSQRTPISILLENLNFFESLIQKNKLLKDDFVILLENLTESELKSVFLNPPLVEELLKNHKEFFIQHIQQHKQKRNTYFDISFLFRSKSKTLKKLLKSNVIDTADIHQTLSSLNSLHTLEDFCNTPVLVEHLLSHSLFKKEIVKNFENILHKSWRSFNHNFFDFLLTIRKNNEAIYELAQIHLKVFKFKNLTDDNLKILIELCKTSREAQDKLEYLFVYNLENLYDFEDLLKYLTKKEKKTTLSI